MGQQEVKTSKISKSNAEFPTIEILPSPLKAFGQLIIKEKPSKIGPKQFLLTRSKDSEFTITISRDVDDLAIYEGFLEVHQGSDKIFAGNVKNLRREGFGVEFDLGGRVFYRGEFSNDLYHGWGQTVRYKGEFRDGRK